VRFTVDGQAVAGFTHESLAAAILASGRTALSRSLRFHRPRAMFCSTGECGWCAMEVDGVPNVPTCSTACRAGAAARSQNAWPSAEWDLFALLDLASPILPYTFFHHRFLHPPQLRQFYLRCLRFFTGAVRLRAGLVPSRLPAPRTRSEVRADIAVVGAGPAGLSAALAAAEAGAQVVLVNDRADLGGFRSGLDAGELSVLLQRVAQTPALACWHRATCLGLYGSNTLGILTPDQLVSLRADRIILAPGALDAIPLFAQNDLPGVMSARLVERLLKVEGMAPGRQAVVWGSPALAERAVQVLEAAGIEVVRQSGEGEAILAARGRRHVRAATIRTAAGQTLTVPCDLIVIAALQPRSELLAQAGGETHWDDSSGGLVAIRSQYLETTIPGIYVAGEAAGCADAPRCIAEGRLAGLVAARSLGRPVGSECETLADSLTLMRRPLAMPLPAQSQAAAGHVLSFLVHSP
jgi:sarcosine oxidase subunit alpha